MFESCFSAWVFHWASRTPLASCLSCVLPYYKSSLTKDIIALTLTVHCFKVKVKSGFVAVTVIGSKCITALILWWTYVLSQGTFIYLCKKKCFKGLNIKPGRKTHRLRCQLSSIFFLFFLFFWLSQGVSVADKTSCRPPDRWPGILIAVAYSGCYKVLEELFFDRHLNSGVYSEKSKFQAMFRRT